MIMNKHYFGKRCWKVGYRLQIRASKSKKMITFLRFYVFYGLTVLSLTGCIEPFDPVGVRDSAGILVVEGMILEEGTTIKLSRTVKLDEKLSRTGLKDLNDAIIQVIDESKNVVAVAEPKMNNDVAVSGTYIIRDKIVFTPGIKYALDIKTGNKHYQSAFVLPVRTPEIDEVSWKINDDLSLDIMVSTHDPENEVNYYRWAFEEDWEYTATFVALYRYDPLLAQIVEQDLSTPNNRFYCWSSNVSKEMLLGTTDRLTEAVIKNKPVLSIPAYDSRLSFLYSILVKQYGLDKESYIYYENLRKNVEDNGTIFGPQPNEKTGNIRCLSNPDEPVIGYIAISKETTSRIFIDVSRMIPFDERGCSQADLRVLLVSQMIHNHNNGWGIYEYWPPSSTFRGADIKCLDCTIRGGTKNKPDFWPNNHQ